jgi:APA family basic amino acid/polyamine antiporter
LAVKKLNDPKISGESFRLQRQIAGPAAVLLGLGSMVGSGVFVSLGLGAGLAGPMVLLAIVLAGGLAMCNGMSSAQLAAAYPVAGGTYEYGHRVGWPLAGAVAGVMFLLAKSASAATAALGVAGYVLHRFAGQDGAAAIGALQIGGGLAALVMLTVVVLEGIRRTNTVNAVIVGLTFLGLLLFVGFGLLGIDPANLDPRQYVPAAGPGDGATARRPETAGLRPWTALPAATALMFVAYTGYGRIATLGEEVREPRRTIPRAIVVTVTVCVVTYVLVAATGVGLVGAAGFAQLAEGGAPLEAIAERRGWPAVVIWFITISAVTALLGVLLNLVLGLSRVALAMGRRGHLPKVFARVDEAGATPAPAVLLVAAIVAGLVCVGSIKAAWSFSAVTVLIYYGITNAAALRLGPEHRLYPRLFSWLGLVGCLGLSLFVEPVYWIGAGAAIAGAAVWHAITRNKPTD